MSFITPEHTQFMAELLMASTRRLNMRVDEYVTFHVVAVDHKDAEERAKTFAEPVFSGPFRVNAIKQKSDRDEYGKIRFDVVISADWT